MVCVRVLQCSVSVSCAQHGEFVLCACSGTSLPGILCGTMPSVYAPLPHKRLQRPRPLRCTNCHSPALRRSYPRSAHVGTLRPHYIGTMDRHIFSLRTATLALLCNFAAVTHEAFAASVLEQSDADFVFNGTYCVELFPNGFFLLL